MTYKEAIKKIKSYMSKDNNLNDKDIEAFNMAIDALKKIDNYEKIIAEEKEKSTNEIIDKFANCVADYIDEGDLKQLISYPYTTMQEIALDFKNILASKDVGDLER